MRIVSSREMREIEARASSEMKFGESLIVENVGREGAAWIESHMARVLLEGEVLLLVGKGNNGADGLAIGRHLTSRGFSVRAFMLFKNSDCSEELKVQAHMAHSFGVKINEVANSKQISAYFNQLNQRSLVIDAVLGTGFRPPLSRDISETINMINRLDSTILSVDVPTGICSDTGTVSGNAIEADYTLTVGLPKTGFFFGKGAQHAGEMVVLQAGLPKTLLQGGDKQLLTPALFQGLYFKRNKWKYKNAFGHTLVVGGSSGLTGAAVLTAHAALRAGTGLVTVKTWPESYQELGSRLPPEIMLGHICEDFAPWNSIVIGPGLGRAPKGRHILLKILNSFTGPVVVDADALHVLDLKKDASLIAQRKWPTVLTPHMGEFAHLKKIKTGQLLEHSLDHLRQMIEECNCCVVMKGASTCIGLPDGKVYINHYPNDGMASAGSGDVLAGIVGGLLAQYPVEMKSSSLFADQTVAFNAVLMGVMIHTLAGKHAVKRWGAHSMKAGNIIEHLSNAFSELDSKAKGEM